MKHAVLPYSVVEQLRTRKEVAAYLDAWLTDAPDDVAGVIRALADIARAQGMIKMARDAGLVEDGNPSLATVLKVVNALGLRLRAEAA